MKQRSLAYIVISILLAIASCNSGEHQPAITGNGGDDSIEAINTGDVTTELPQAGDVALIEANCVPCHSLRYIQMQPELSYKAWEKIVDKMITAYGAPVRDDVTREKVIGYLYAIRGKKEVPKGVH